MNHSSTEADRAWLKSMGFDDDLIDHPAGTRLIGVLFGDPADEAAAGEAYQPVDGGFACVA